MNDDFVKAIQCLGTGTIVELIEVCMTELDKRGKEKQINLE